MFPIFEFISLFSYLNLLVYSQNLNAGGGGGGGGGNESGFCGQFILIFFFVLL